MTTQKVRLGGYALIAPLVIAGAVIVIAALQRDERPPVSREGRRRRLGSMARLRR
jgi:hypothetical protein